MYSFISKRKTELFIFLSTGIHLIMGGLLNLTDDGAYYWVYSRYLDLSYYDHPPMIAYWIRFFTAIFGNNNFAVRLTPVLAITITSILIYKIILYLYQDRERAFWGVVLFNFIPIFAVLSFMALPDLPLMVFFTLDLYFLLRIVYEQKPRFWYLVGIITGLGLLSKYNMFLVYPGVFFYLLLDGKQRFWLKRKEVYLAFIISLLIFLPVLIWNIQNDWASFTFHLYQRHDKSLSFKLDLFTIFIVAQLLIASPVIFVGIWKAIMKNFYNHEVKLLFFYGAPTFFIFLLVSLFTEYKLHWTALAYIPFLIILAGYIPWNRFWKYAGLGLAVLITLLLYLQSFYPVLPINPQDDVTTDMHGWDQVGLEVQRIYNQLNEEEWFLFSNRYQLSSQLQFYLPENNFVYSLNKRTEQYDFWQDEKELIGKNGIFVNHSFYQSDPEKIYYFDRVDLIKKIDILRAGQIYRTFYIYKCYNYRGIK